MAWLRDQGVNLWYDEGISAGKNWRTVIGDSLLRATNVLFYISTGSLESDHCNREINLALDEGKHVIPIYIEDIALTTDLKVGLNRVQALHRDQDTNYRAHLLNSLGQSTVPIETPPKTERSRNRFPGRVGVGLILALLVSVVWWYFPRLDERRIPAPVMTEALISDVADTLISIAVLPFTNMSNDPEQEFFSDGISEDLLTALSRNSSLIVRARASTFALKGTVLDLRAIGNRLDVTHVLEGSVRRSGDRIRISVQLNDVAADRSTWSDQYDFESFDIFTVQDRITQEVVGALSKRLVQPPVARSFVSNEANEAFYLGRYELNRLNLPEAERMLLVATKLNPVNSEAWGLLAYTSLLQVFSSRVPNSEAAARERNSFINKALVIDPNNPNALGVKAYFDFIYARDYQASVDQLADLVRANPNNARAPLFLSYILSGLGDDELVGQIALRTLALDPLSGPAQGMNVYSLLNMKKIREAREALVTSEQAKSDPNLLFAVAWTEGDLNGMHAALSHQRLKGHPNYPVYAAIIAHLEGHYAQVKEIAIAFAESTAYKSFVVRSRIDLIGGNFQSAVELWREGVLSNEPQAVLSMLPDSIWLATFPEFYESPKYLEMLVEFGLDEQARSTLRIPDLESGVPR